jgi:hypothetical protein
MDTGSAAAIGRGGCNFLSLAKEERGTHRQHRVGRRQREGGAVFILWQWSACCTHGQHMVASRCRGDGRRRLGGTGLR